MKYEWDLRGVNALCDIFTRATVTVTRAFFLFLNFILFSPIFQWKNRESVSLHSCYKLRWILLTHFSISRHLRNLRDFFLPWIYLFRIVCVLGYCQQWLRSNSLNARGGHTKEKTRSSNCRCGIDGSLYSPQHISISFLFESPWTQIYL